MVVRGVVYERIVDFYNLTSTLYRGEFPSSSKDFLGVEKESSRSLLASAYVLYGSFLYGNRTLFAGSKMWR